MSFLDIFCKREIGSKWTKRIALVAFVLFVFGFVLFLCFRASSNKISRTSASVQNYNDEPKLPLLKYTNPSVVTEKVQKQENVSWSYSNDCQTEFCQDYSKILSKHMDISTDPCKDFHQYVCGNWDSNSRTAFYQMQVDIYGTVLVALSKTKRSKSKAVQYVLDLYKEFVDKRTRTKVDLRSIRPMLQKVIGRGQWPLPASVPTLSWSDQAKISNQFDQFWDSDSASSIKSKLDRTEYLIDFKQFWDSWKSWKLRPDHTNSSLDNTANVNQWMDWYVEMLMIRYQPLVSITSWDVKAQKMKANEISLLKVEVSEDIDKLYVNYRGFKKLAMLFMELGELDWGSSLNNAIFEVLDFYTELSSIFPKSMSNSKPETESEQNMKTITLGELKQNYSSPHFDWSLLLNKFAARTGASVRFTDKDTVRVKTDQLALFRPFTELLVRTPIRVLKNEMGWKFIRIPTVLSLIHDRDEKSNANFVIKNFDEFESIFVRLSVDFIGRRKMLSAREQATELVRHLKENFSDSMKHDHVWLDDKTRQNALDKLEAMRMMTAFPDWILDDAVLDENYGFSQPYLYTIDSPRFIKGEYITSFLNFRRLSMGAEFRKNDQSLHVDREFQFFIDMPAYSLHSNLIGVSHALLTDPWFNVDYPPSVNYGKFGFIITHEMMHAFDQEGRLYDKNGEMVNWWTDYTSKHFERLSKCFVHQYDGLVEPITGLKINGTATLADNIADNGGLNQAYRAFEKVVLKHWHNPQTFEAYPSFRVQFTPEQLFFVSYGMIWCSHGDDLREYAENVRNGTHSPNRFRVNIPLSNMAQFSKAFNCPVGSPMNPEHKCSIW